MNALALLTAMLLAAEPAASATPAAPSVSSAPSNRFDLGASAVFGLGENLALGGLIEGTYGLKLWEAGRAEGLLDLGLMLGYQAMPYSLANSMLGSASASGAGHRLETFAVVGHSLRLPPSRRGIFSVQLFGGWTHLWIRGGLKNPTYGVDQPANADDGMLTTGIIGQLGFQVTDRVALLLKCIAPFPYGNLATNSYVMASLGVAVHLY